MRNISGETVVTSVLTLALIAVLVTPPLLLTAADLPMPRPNQQAQQPSSQPSPRSTDGRGSDFRSVPQTRAESSADNRRAETPAAPPAATTPAPAPAAGAIVLDNRAVAGILGREVRSAADENMGRIVDVIVDQSGRTRAAIIDFGGFLGVGSRKIAVDWSALHFSPGKEKDRIILELTRDQVKAAPEYQEGKPVVVLGALAGTDRVRLSTSATSER